MAKFVTLTGLRRFLDNLVRLLDKKQNKLVSGENIKTVNNQPILGSGNLDISAPSVEIVDNLASTATDKALSANMGRTLNDTKMKLDKTARTGMTRQTLYALGTDGTIVAFSNVKFTQAESPNSNANTMYSVFVSRTDSNNGEMFAIGSGTHLYYCPISDGLYSDWASLASEYDFSDYVKFTDVINNLTSTAVNKPLSANMGRVLSYDLPNFDSGEQFIEDMDDFLRNTVPDSKVSIYTYVEFDSAIDPNPNYFSWRLICIKANGPCTVILMPSDLMQTSEIPTTYLAHWNEDEGFLGWKRLVFQTEMDAALAGKIDAAGTGLTKSGTKLNHSNAITAGSAGSTTSIPKITYDAQGHITAVQGQTVYPPTTAGAANQYWRSDGSGQGVWQTPAATPASGSAVAFTAGGAYTELAKKLDKTSVSEDSSTGIITITT